MIGRGNHWAATRLYLFVCLFDWWAGIRSLINFPNQTYTKETFRNGRGSFRSAKFYFFKDPSTVKFGKVLDDLCS